MDVIASFFREIYQTTGWNFSVFFNPWETEKYIRGVVVAIELALMSLAGSLIVGTACAFGRVSRVKILRWLIGAYVEFFRNTPGLAQLYFLFFGIGSYFGLSIYGPQGQPPILSPLQFVAIALSLQYGAFAAEILRSGIEAVPQTTIEAAQALGYSRVGTLWHVSLPLALRISLPALGNNIAQIVKGTAMAYAIAVPEALYVAHEIWTEHFNVIEMMNVVLLTYLALMGVFTLIVKLLERWLHVPGMGR